MGEGTGEGGSFHFREVDRAGGEVGEHLVADEGPGEGVGGGSFPSGDGNREGEEGSEFGKDLPFDFKHGKRNTASREAEDVAFIDDKRAVVPASAEKLDVRRM